MHSETDLEALERFVIDNDDLLALESRIGRFNIFDALGITRAEIRHSNFLAYILDPAESHGQGQLFLKAVLMDLLKKAPTGLRPISPIDLDGTDLRGVEVKREWKNIDLLITCEEPRFAIVVENKVDSQDHSNQLNRYCDTVKKAYPDVRSLNVFLTPDASEPCEDTNEAWFQYGYADIHRVLSRVRKTYNNAIGDDVLVFLDHYLNLLGTRFMYDPDLDDLCRKIYKNHRQALDLIWARVGTPERSVIAEISEIVKADKRWHVYGERSRSYLDFVPKSWRDWLPEFGMDQDKKNWIVVEIKFMGDDQLVCIVFVGPMADASKRKEIVASLRAAVKGPNLPPCRSTKETGVWSRITGAKTICQWNEDESPPTAEITKKLTPMLNELHSELEELALFLKPLCGV